MKTVFINFLNKEKNFQPDKKYFFGPAEAAEWGRKNLEHYSPDMMHWIPVKTLQALKIIQGCTANIWSHPKGPRGGKEEPGEVCEYCGKHTPDDKSNYFHILTSGLIIPVSISEETIKELSEAGLINDDSQGCFKIGYTCAKKLLGHRVKEFLVY